MPSAAHNVVYIISLCSLATQQVLYNFEFIIQVITLHIKLKEVTPVSEISVYREWKNNVTKCFIIENII